MTIASTLDSIKAKRPIRTPEPAVTTPGPRFLHSLRFKGYLFIILVLAYMLLATSFFFGQRDPPLHQLEAYQVIQGTRVVLDRAETAAFNAALTLAANFDGDPSSRFMPHLEQLHQQFRTLAILQPTQAAILDRLEPFLPSALPDDLPARRRQAELHLAEARVAIERLSAANQERLAALIEDYRERDDLLVIKSMIAGTLGLVLIVTLTSLFFNRLKSDLLRLSRRTAELVSGHRRADLPVTRDDEVGQLTEGINFLASTLAEREQAIEIQRRKESFREKMIAIDSLAGGIAQAVGNPITCIAGLAGEIEADVRNRLSAQSRSMLEQLQQHTNGVIRISRDLSQLDSREFDRIEWIDINQLLATAVRRCRYDHRWSDIDISLELDPRVPALYASETQFNQAATHLLDNAREALFGLENARLRIRTELDAEDATAIVFEDNGPGVADADLHKIFEPFYTSRNRGEASGLGLTICAAITHASHGRIQACSGSSGGFRIKLLFPAGRSLPESR